MYLKYGLYVAPVILITAFAAWLFLKVSGRADRSNNRILIFGTISASAVALLIPAIARALLERLSLSIILSVISAFLLCSLILGFGFILAHVFVKKDETPDDSSPGILEYLIAEPAATLEAIPPVSEEPSDIGEYKQKIVDTGRNTDKIGVEENSNNEEMVKKLLKSALDCRMQGRFAESVACYREILNLTPDKRLASQIIIEICGISKQIKNTQLIYEILNSEQGNLLDYEIKTDILNNI